MLKKIGTRKIDPLGRIVLPQEGRNGLNIDMQDLLDVFLEEDSIIIRKNINNICCTLCGTSSNALVPIFNGLLCTDCIGKIKAMSNI